MDIELVVTVVVLVALLLVMVRELVSPSAAMIGALVTLVLTGTVEPEQAFRGFSSTATITVAALFVVAYAIQQHAGLEQLLQSRLGGARSDRGILARLCVPVAAASAVIANTPLVAALAPVVRSWSDRVGRPPSRVLMPLSFATILGGTATTIGTSTTLVASGLVEQATGTPFSLLEVTPLGLPMAVAGVVVLILTAPRLLPDRGDAHLSPGSPGDRPYSFRLVVEPGGPLEGTTLADGGLRDLEGLYVAAIDRGSAGVSPARPDSRLLGGDELVIVGNLEMVRDLPTAGLRHADEQQVTELEDDLTGLHEAVVGRTSWLVNRTLKQASFRGRYGAAVLAINRAGERAEGQLGSITLQAGDVLLVRAGSGFGARWRDSGDFAVIAPLDDELHPQSNRRALVLAITAGMIGLAAFGVVALVEAVLFACAALVITRTVSFRDAFGSLDPDVLLIIAAAIGLGTTVESSGLAELVAGAISDLAASAGPLFALFALLVGITLLTEIVTNVASAALMVPIAMRTAEAVGQDPRGWAVAAAVIASSSFLTPIGYQTNTIVYGLGGYRFSDYWRLGLPLVVISIGMALVIVPAVWG